MPSRLSLSVIIPVYNGGDAFCRCLQSLRRSRRIPDEVVVVADGDTDGSRDAARRWGATVLTNATPQGPARARNQGARAAHGEVLLFLDADVTVHTDTIGKVAAAFARAPTLDALIGSYDDAPGADHFLSQYRNLLHHYTHQTAREEASTFWGACGAVRREAFFAVGGFDAERYRRPRIEDIELGHRLRQAGHRIRLRKDIQVKHLKRWSAATMLKTDLFSRSLPWTELILRSRRLDDDLNVDRRSRLSVAAVFALPLTLLAAPWRPAPMTTAAGLLAATFLFLNASFYRFLKRKRGLRFMLGAIPWHALYYGCSGLGFLLGTARHLAGSRAQPFEERPASSEMAS